MRLRTAPLRRPRLRRRDEVGYVAALVAIFASVVFAGVGAVGVDMARWWVEVQRVQSAADAASLAGVTYMPADFPDASAKAVQIAGVNGYPNVTCTTVSTTTTCSNAHVKITVAQGTLPSQLKVSVSSRVTNSFGRLFGDDSTWVTRSSMSDYTAPAPMGSPCNTFANEPPSPDGSALPSPAPSNCSAHPQFWGAIEGPSTDKVQGDRFMTTACSGSDSSVPGEVTYQCSGGQNNETNPEGYFFAVHVEPAAVGTQIAIQLYDPDFFNTGASCQSISGLTGATNPNAVSAGSSDSAQRYAGATSSRVGNTTVYTPVSPTFCDGDDYPGVSRGTPTPPTTSFDLRGQTDTQNPMNGAPISQCNRQFVGQTGPPSASELTSTTTTTTTKNGKTTTTTSNSKSYDLQKAQTFHAWYPLCTFTPTTSGDYYLQVRTNVDVKHATAVPNVNAAGTSLDSLIYQGNPDVYAANGDTTSGSGSNSFSIRAIPSTPSMRSLVAVSGYDNMPILQNASGSTATFNLIRALPGTHGENIAFDFFDAGDATSAGTVKIVPPADVTGSLKTASAIPGCRSAIDLGSYSSASNCTAQISSSSNDGQVEHLIVPIPSDYGCNSSTLSGCWFQVQITFPGAASVTDFTTWSANITGDPVRLVK